MIYFIIIMIVLVIVLMASLYFVKLSLYPNTQSTSEVYEKEILRNEINDAFFKNLEKEEVFMDSDYGYKLHGFWVPYNQSKKTMIICHGYTVNLSASIKYLEIFHNKGFNVLLYDHRHHGESEGKNCTMGYYEKFDLQKWVSWVIDKNGKEGVIGTHGESLGGATVLMHAAIDDRISFVISDCAFESVFKQFQYRLKVEYHLPAFPILYGASLITKVLVNAFYKDIAPISTIKSVNTPILFIHGNSDDYIPTYHALHLYDLKPGKKAIYLAEEAGHAESLKADRVKYISVIDDFLSDLNL